MNVTQELLNTEQENQRKIKLVLDVMTYVIEQANLTTTSSTTTTATAPQPNEKIEENAQLKPEEEIMVAADVVSESSEVKSVNTDLLALYKESYWKYPIENEMRKADVYPLLKPFIFKFATSKSEEKRAKLYQKKQKYTVYSNQVEAEFQRLIQSTENPEKKLMLQNQLQTMKVLQQHTDACTSSKENLMEYQPALLELPLIQEDPMEWRWDSRGRGVAIGRNILNQTYASIHDPLSYMRRYKGQSAHIYEYMKPLIRDYLLNREKSRIARLNARRTTAIQFPDRVKKQIQHDGISSEEHPVQELSLEALETKFDTMFEPEVQEQIPTSELFDEPISNPEEDPNLMTDLTNQSPAA